MKKQSHFKKTNISSPENIYTQYITHKTETTAALINMKTYPIYCNNGIKNALLS